MNHPLVIPIGLAMALLSVAPEFGRAQALKASGSMALGVELAGVGTLPERRGPGLAFQVARDAPLGNHAGWRLAAIYSMTTANPSFGRTYGSYLLLGASIGPQVSPTGPYLRLGAGVMQSHVTEPNRVSYRFTGMAGYGAAGLRVTGRMFVEMTAIAPTTGAYGRPYVALLVGRRNRPDTP